MSGARVPVGVVGANGFLGGELVRLLTQHPHVALVRMCAGRSAGQQISAVRPSLRGPADGLLRTFDAADLAEHCEVVFLALPHGESAKVGRALRAQGTTVIDLGSDFRLRRPADHVRYYKREPSAPELLDEACYSLPELTGPPPEGTKLIANPGCFATALSIGLAPLVGYLEEDAAITVFGVTGSSGSGVVPKASTHHTLRVNSFTAYKTLRHQHLGEVRQLLAGMGDVPHIRFIPHSLPAPRGIHLTLTVPRHQVLANPLSLYEQRYEGAALVDVVEGEIPMGAVVQSCRTLVGVSGDDEDLVVFVAIDNLLKGGSGQAIQNLNLLYGWSETAGLPIIGSWP